MGSIFWSKKEKTSSGECKGMGAGLESWEVEIEGKAVEICGDSITKIRRLKIKNKIDKWICSSI